MVPYSSNDGGMYANAPGGMLPHESMINITCESGYELVGDAEVYCYNGTSSQPPMCEYSTGE